ncbi:MAG: hypothetical protein AB8H80_23845 [Planctomycetota bacterium]
MAGVSVASQELDGAIARVDNDMESVASGSQESLAAVSELRSLAGEVQAILGRFKF